jgi:hypothetical protein
VKEKEQGWGEWVQGSSFVGSDKKMNHLLLKFVSL